MTYQTKFLSRTNLCIVNTGSIHLDFIAWALSKKFNAIYIEQNHQLLGYIPLSQRIKSFSTTAFQIIPHINSIDYDNYINTLDKNNLFSRSTDTFIPVIKDNQIQGELIKITPLPNFAKLYWEIIDDESYLHLFNYIGCNILFSSLDKRTLNLYDKLKSLNSFQLALYTPNSNTDLTHQYDVVILHSPHHECKYYKASKTLYATVDYLYQQLLAIPIFNFYKQNNISFYYIQLPSSFNKLPPSIQDNLYPYSLSVFAQDTAAHNKYYGDNHNRKFFENEDYKKVAVIDNGLKHCLKDCTSETYNVIDGKRLTIGTPASYTNSIHCFGPCIVRGGYVCDDSTICSYLQENLNNKQANWLRVLNYGVEGGINSIYDLYNMIATSYRQNDIVLLFGNITYRFLLADEFDINIIDSLPIYSEENLKTPCIINSLMHVTHIFNKLLADYIFSNLNINSYFPDPTPPKEIKINTPRTKISSSELLSYKDTLIKYRIPDYLNKKIGAIVMNCNPFTLGHLYLVEEALKSVDHLYIFIVEEDKSFFSFTDRYQLAQLCCSHLKNVTILPSGKFIISTTTFPEYFFKDQLQNVVINPSNDIELFGAEIAPMLNITYRFLGEEPSDRITAQYNSFLKAELGHYNIQVIELPRKSINNKIVNASEVRKLISQNNIAATKDLLPLPTYDFICNKFCSALLNSNH